MASKGIQDILGWVALTKAVNAVKDGVPNPFPPWLFNVKGENQVVGESFKFNRLYGTRKVARRAQYGAAPRHRELQKEELIEAKMIHYFEERIFDPLILAMLREYDRYDNARMAKQLVANNIKTQGTLFGNARIVSVATSLATGNIYFDSNLNMLPSSSGADARYTFTQNVPAANIGTVTDNASAGIFGATGGGSWAVNSTDIPLQLRRLQELAASTHGYIPRIALYGKNIPSYMTQNDFVLDYLARNPTRQTEWLEDNTVPDGLFGFTWVPVWTASMDKDDDTHSTIWPANTITFIPGEEDLDAWYALAEGSYEVPTSIDIARTAEAAFSNLTRVFGAFGYSQVSHKPVSVATLMGDTFVPAFKIPEVVYIADTVS